MAGGALSRVVRRWWPVLALALVLAALQSKLWFGAGGLPDARALQQSVLEQRADNARLEQRNDALGAEVEDLKSGETAVEERARSELGMIKPGETFYRVVEPHNAAALPRPAVPAPGAATTDTPMAGDAPVAPAPDAAQSLSPAAAAKAPTNPADAGAPPLPTVDPADSIDPAEAADTTPPTDAPEPTP